MTPVGVPGPLEPNLVGPSRLEVAIKQKFFHAATGGRLLVLDGLSLTLANGEVGALVGPSGCGKTTLLRIIAGLDRDYEGKLTLPDHGRPGVVFQEPRFLLSPSPAHVVAEIPIMRPRTQRTAEERATIRQDVSQRLKQVRG